MPVSSDKESLRAVKASELKAILGTINLIDIRQHDDYEDGHVPTAVNVPMEDVIERTEEYLDKDKEYYIICQLGEKSKETCEKLVVKGYNVVNVCDGTESYDGVLE